MDEFRIPHAVKALVDRSEAPLERLVVWTPLPEHSPVNREARARQDMGNAIAAEVSSRQLDGYDIKWSFGAPTPEA